MNSIDNHFICEPLYITYFEGKYEITVLRNTYGSNLKSFWKPEWWNRRCWNL